MIEKKTEKNPDSPIADSGDETPPEPTSRQQREMKKRFGAMSFVENVDLGIDMEVLSFDSLREAFAGLDRESLGTISEAFQSDPANNEEFEEVDSQTNEPVYDDDFLPEPMESVSGAVSSRPWQLNADRESLFESDDSERGIELSPRTIVEAILFVGDRNGKAVSADKIAEKMRNVEPEEIDEAVHDLNRTYRRLGCPYIINKEPEGYRMVLRQEFESIRTKFYGKIREARLSQQAIDTLAVVAYRQPISAEEVQRIRKQPSSSLLSQLVRRGLLEIQLEWRGKKKVPLYKTSDRFLELFQLESIDDLPIAEELDFR